MLPAVRTTLEIPFQCKCGYGCGTEKALQKHFARFAGSSAHGCKSNQPTDDGLSDEIGSHPINPSSHMNMEDLPQDGDVCRFCLDSGEETLHSLCGCRGSGHWLHISCLRQWMASAQTLVNHPTEIAREQRHTLCSVCREPFQGVKPPSRLEVIAGMAQFDPLQLKEGVLLRYANLFPVAELEDPSTSFIVENKRKHFQSSVYLIVAVQQRASDSEGADDAIIGINLTRSIDSVWAGSDRLDDRTCGNLSQGQVDTWRRHGIQVAISLGGPVAPAKVGCAILLSDDEPQGWNIGDIGSLAERAITAASKNPTAGRRDVQLRVALGKAQWTRSQLLGEIARGSWGVACNVEHASWLGADYCHCRSVGGLWSDLAVGRELYWAPSNPMREDFQRRSQQQTESQ